MMEHALVRTSKFLSLILRHQPGKIGLALDANGWAEVDELLQKAGERGFQIDRPTLERVVAENDKQRFAFSPDGTRIRASQGHSIQVDLQLEPLAPPEVLYHGTAERFQAAIVEQGLLPRSRQHVHLSGDVETALRVGRRHGKPVVFQIQAGVMERDGLKFYRSANGVWLTEHVPAQYLGLFSGSDLQPGRQAA
jgi:putative RNA 2'-phosphotransferase